MCQPVPDTGNGYAVVRLWRGAKCCRSISIECWTPSQMACACMLVCDAITPSKTHDINRRQLLSLIFYSDGGQVHIPVSAEWSNSYFFIAFFPHSFELLQTSNGNEKNFVLLRSNKFCSVGVYCTTCGYYEWKKIYGKKNLLSCDCNIVVSNRQHHKQHLNQYSTLAAYPRLAHTKTYYTNFFVMLLWKWP